MHSSSRRFSRIAAAVVVALAGYCAGASAAEAVTTVQGMPPVVNPANLYSEASAGHQSPAVSGALSRVYVPNLRSNDVYVIDPATYKVVDKFPVGYSPQHVVPSWDLHTLWVANNAKDLDPEKDKAKIKEITRFSDEYFALVKANTPDENAILAAQQDGEELLCKFRGQAYRVR